MPEEGDIARATLPQEPGTNEQQISVNKSNIKVPVDIQDALEIKEELYGADGTSAQGPITLDKRGYTLIQFDGHSSSAAKPHTFTVEYSFDNITWYNQYTSPAPEQNLSKTVESAARYWRISSDAVAGAHNIDLVLGAVVG